LFRTTAQSLQQARHDAQLAVLFIDLDHFRINDTWAIRLVTPC
jgi:GGDEF domain-containing protein